MYKCEKCLKNFSSKRNLQSHGNVCKGHQISTPHTHQNSIYKSI